MKNEALESYREELRRFSKMESSLRYHATPVQSGVHRIGLDFHGVITASPVFLAAQAKKLMDDGHEVHIMTGSRYDEGTDAMLGEYGFTRGVHYSHYFSITDHLISTGEEVSFRHGMPYADTLLWNSAKGEYAILNHIECLWDDSPAYGRYMPSTCWYFTFSTENFESQLHQVLNGGRPKVGSSSGALKRMSCTMGPSGWTGLTPTTYENWLTGEFV